MRSVLTSLLILTTFIMSHSENPTRLTPTEVNPGQTAGRNQLGDFAPKFAELNDDVLFGQVWSRTNKLSARDRSVVTVTALVASGIIDSSLTYHLTEARKNGVTRTEIAEILTQIAFYAGWPKAWGAFRQAAEVWRNDTDASDAKARHEQELMFPIGEPNDAYAAYFSGQSYLAPVSTDQVKMFNVTFEPGCRNKLAHPPCHLRRRPDAYRSRRPRMVSGRGKDPVAILPGTVIHIPANVKHWHGAAADSWFSHLAVEIDGSETSNEWCEPVSDEAYEILK